MSEGTVICWCKVVQGVFGTVLEVVSDMSISGGGLGIVIRCCFTAYFLSLYNIASCFKGDKVICAVENGFFIICDVQGLCSS